VTIRTTSAATLPIAACARQGAPGRAEECEQSQSRWISDHYRRHVGRHGRQHDVGKPAVQSHRDLGADLRQHGQPGRQDELQRQHAQGRDAES
jgi:hypothetical protein